MKRINNFNKVLETEFALSAGRVNILYYDFPKRFSDDYKSYDCPRLCTIIDGIKEVSINNAEKFTYSKDKFILLPSHSTVHMSIEEDTRALLYEFGEDIIQEVTQKVCDNLEMDVPGCEQGRLAGQMARKILQDGLSPNSIEMVSSHQGVPMLNLARANGLGIEVDVRSLLNYAIIKGYNWEE